MTPISNSYVQSHISRLCNVRLIAIGKRGARRKMRSFYLVVPLNK